MGSDPYAVLEVGKDASPDEIRKAYKRLALAWHPDRNKDPAATERFREIAAAWAIVGDPQRRFAHDGRRAGGLDGDYVDRVATAIERAQDYIERVVLPHYGSRYRGIGAEIAAELLRDAPRLMEASWLVPRVSWLGRRRAARWRREIDVAFGEGRLDPTELVHHRTGWTVRVSPAGLWTAGVRDASAVDDTVLRLLLIRYAQILGGGRIAAIPDPTDRSDRGGWDGVVALARRRDDEVVRARVSRWSMWIGLALILALMFYAGTRNL